MLMEMVIKDQDTLIEQSLCLKYCNRAVTHACKLEILQLILLMLSNNYREFSSKILSKIGKKKELLERKIGGKKSKIGSFLHAFKIMQGRRSATAHGVIAGDPEATLHINNKVTSMLLLFVTVYLYPA